MNRSIRQRAFLLGYLNKEAVLKDMTKSSSSMADQGTVADIPSVISNVNSTLKSYKGVGDNVAKITAQLHKILKKGEGATTSAVIGGGTGLAAGIGGSALTDYLSNEEVDEKKALLMGLAGAGAGAAGGVYLNNRKPRIENG